jgi:hypothetical protein
MNEFRFFWLMKNGMKCEWECLQKMKNVYEVVKKGQAGVN